MTDTKKYHSINELLESEEAEEMTASLYSNELEAVEALLEIRFWQYDSEKKETFYTIEDLESAIDDLDRTTRYSDTDSYFDSMDDLLQFSNENSVEARYFDYDAYHRDCMYDVTEASNGVIIADW